MKYYIRDKEIDIDITKKPFGEGSEGKIYVIDGITYKIYFPSMLNEGMGNKKGWHQYLMTINTSQIILPTDSIYDENYSYIGYTAPLIKGDQKDKTGITKMPSNKLIKNLSVLENDFQLLTNNYVIAADVTPFNYIYDEENNIMNVIDPGRYKKSDNKLLQNIKLINNKQLDTLIELLIYMDFIKYKPIGSKRKSQLLKDRIISDKKDLRYSEYFKEKLKGYENLEEYSKTLGKYIK